MSLKTSLALSLGFTASLVSASALAGGSCTGPRCYELVTTPAEYSTVSEDVMVAPERQVARRTPAEYGYVEETVTLKPARTVARHIPAVTQTVAEQVLISPATKTWQVTRDAHGRTVGCWVKVPAKYGVRHRTVVVQEASVAYDTIPAVQGTRTRKVMMKPANVEYETIPAVYQTRHRQVMTRAATRGWRPIDSRY